MSEYAVGYSWADAAYQSLPSMDFVNVVIGDPLMLIQGDLTPPAEVSAFSATAKYSEVDLSWTNPTDADFAGVKVVRKIGSYPVSVADGAIVYSGTGTSYDDTGLTNDTAYYYTAFSYDHIPNYASGTNATGTPSVPSLSQGEPDIYPPGKPTGFNASAGNRNILLSWTNPTDPDFSKVEIIRRTNRYPVSINDGVLVYRGSSTSYEDTGLSNGTTYFYTIFALDQSDNPSVRDSNVETAATPFSGSPISNASPGSDPSTLFTEPVIGNPGDISGLVANASGGQITLSWTNPPGNTREGTRIVRKTGSYPATITDGTTIYQGNGSSFTDTSVTSGVTYYYKGFSYDSSRNYGPGTSSGARASATAQ
jgi:hypothetical protein